MAKAKKKAGQKIIKPGKDIVASTANALRKKLLGIVEKGATPVIIDLTRVEMIDSVGLGVLIATHNSLSKAGGRLAVTNVSKDIYGLFKTMRLDQHFEVKQVS